jgi:hypothetical protein
MIRVTFFVTILSDYSHGFHHWICFFRELNLRAAAFGPQATVRVPSGTL